MKKFLPLLLAFIFCLPAWSANVGQPQQIQPSSIPGYSDWNILPSMGTPVSTRSVGAAVIGAYNSTTFAAVGAFPAMSAYGTASNATGADGNWVNYLTASSNGGAASSSPFIQFRQNPRMVCTIKTGSGANDLTNNVLWVGIENAQNNNTGTPGGTVDMAAFRYAPAVDGTAYWRVVTNHFGTSNVITTTYPIALGTEYTLAIDASAGTSGPYYFYINGTLVASTSTDLPTSNANCYLVVLNSYTTTNQVNIKIKNIWIDYQ